MKETEFIYSDEVFADIQMLRYQLNDFDLLSLKQKEYIYYLSKATLCGRDITTDQFGQYNLVVRKVLETIYTTYYGDKTSKEYKCFETYLKRIWFSNGIYHHYSCDKILPGFSESYFKKLLNIKGVKGLLPLCDCETTDELYKKLLPIMFRNSYKSKRVNKTPGEDLVKSSACNFYDGVSQDEAEEYYAKKKSASGENSPSWGLNTKLVKKDGEICEQTWKKNSLYGAAIRQIIYWLDKACNVAENEQQKKVIQLLIDYYTTGNLSTFDKYSIEWINEQEGDIDFINGFIEVYGDPLGIKGSWEGIVEYKDKIATLRTKKISDNAQWFEDHSPIDNKFKKEKVKGISANVVCAAMLGGDEYPSTAIGINLPNADWIRAEHGSKSVTIGNLTQAYNKASMNNGFYEEFIIDGEIRKLIEQYGALCDNLHTDLHECLGHGSGKLLPGVSPDALKAYSDVIEEARADLFGLYYLPDKKLLELGIMPNNVAYKSQYYTYIMNGLITQLSRIKIGDKIQEAHMRNRALIAHWVYEKGNGCIEYVKHKNKTYINITNYAKLRLLFATLLAEIQRIKSEGDFLAAQQLVEKYGVDIDTELHKEVRERYDKLKLAPYKGFINPHLIPILDEIGNIKDIKVDYKESYSEQMLRYSKEYGFLI